MAKLVHIKSLVNTPNAVETNSMFNGIDGIEAYRTDKFYVPGDKVLYLNVATNKYEAYKCIVATSGAWFASSWELHNLDRELMNIHDIQENVNSLLASESTHSGMIFRSGPLSNGASFNSTNRDFDGLIQVPVTIDHMANTPYQNFFAFNPAIAIVGGRRVPMFNKLVDPGSSSYWNKVELSQPPLSGTRDDFVFLEVWREQSTKENTLDNGRNSLKYRIRTVANVDFSKYPEGFGYNTGEEVPVTPQGGNSEPVPTNLSYRTYNQFAPASVRSTFGINEVTLPNDYGVFIAGRGPRYTKDQLKTSDGYVYGIPLFKVSRRNSSGYSTLNLNGARNFVELTGTVNYTENKYEVDIICANNTDFEKIKIGDKVDWMNNTTSVREKCEIVNIDSTTNTISFVFSTPTTGSGSIASKIRLLSDRPDGKFANIIHIDDIVDLRHRVSISEIDYEKILNENVDKYLRAELNTNNAINHAKFGLVPTYSGKPNNPLPVFKTVNGEVKSFKNIAYNLGSFITEGNGYFPVGWQKMNDNYPYSVRTYPHEVIDGVKVNKVRITADVSDPSDSRAIFLKYLKAKPNTHYIALVDFLSLTGNGRLRLNVGFYDKLTLTTSIVATSTVAYTGIGKLLFKTDATTTHISPRIYNVGPVGEVSSVDFTKFRIYEISEDLFNAITADPTTYNSARLSNDFPYVTSSPEVLENIWDGQFDNGYINASTATDTTLTDQSNVKLRTTKKIPVDINKSYCISGGVGRMAVMYINAAGNFIKAEDLTADNKIKVLELPTATTHIRVYYYNADVPGTEYPVISEFPINIQVPYGRWINNHNTYDEGVEINTHQYSSTQKRKTWSYAQHTDQVVDLVEPYNTPQKHITVTQATKGTWAVNDTIKIKSDSGKLFGPLDSDTSLIRVVSYADGKLTYLETSSASKIKLESVAGLSVNDTINFIRIVDMTPVDNYIRTISEIDTVNKTITLSTNFESYSIQSYSIVETTSTSSSPIVRLSKTDGTSSSDFTTISWTGLGTSEITGTISAVNTDSNKGTFSIKYSVAYPAGQGLTNLPDEIIDVKVNGQNYVKTTNKTVQSNENFIGKVSGSTTVNPHLAKYAASPTTLPTPEQNGYELGSYNLINSLNGTVWFRSTKNINSIGAALFSFNLIEHVQRTYGTIPGATTADKIAWLRANVKSLTCNWWGYGSSPTGNKATVNAWSGSSWSSYPLSTTSGNVSFLRWNTGNGGGAYVQSDGFVHFLAYAEPSDGTTASVINTDYVELQVELSTDIKTNLLSGDNSQTDDNYELFVPEKQEISYNQNILSQALSYPVDTSLITTSIALLNPGVQLTINSPGVVKGVTTGVAQGIALIADTPTIRKVPHSASFMFKANAGEEFQIHLNDGWLAGANGKDIWVTATGEWQKVTIDNFTPQTTTLVLIIREMWEGTTFYAKDFMINEGVVAKDFVIGRKRTLTINTLEKIINDSFSTTPRVFYRTDTLLTTMPDLSSLSSSYTEFDQSMYNTVSKDNGSSRLFHGVTNGHYAQCLFEIDLNHLGIPVSELRKIITDVKFEAYGRGHRPDSPDYVYGLVLERWKVYSASTPGTYDKKWDDDVKVTSTSSSSKGIITSEGGNHKLYITDEGKMYWRLSVLYPSDGTNNSTLDLNYFRVTIKLAEYIDQIKQNVVKIRKSTKEMKLHFPKKSYINGQEDVVEITYTHSKVPNALTTTEKVTILAELDNVFASDLSSSVGFKQGTHHYMNPLYRLGIDSTQVFGDFGFANIPLASDSNNVNTGVQVSITPSGLTNGATRQYGLDVLKKPMVYTFAYLVLHNSELKLMLISRLTTTGKVVSESSTSNQVRLIPIDGRILVKEQMGYERNINSLQSTEWKTPTGEILGYLNDKGEVIVTYQ